MLEGPLPSCGDCCAFLQEGLGPVAKRRPAHAVDRKRSVLVELSLELDGVGVTATGGQYASGDYLALDRWRRKGQGDVCGEGRLSGRAEVVEHGASPDRVIGDRQPLGDAGLVLENVEDAVTGWVETGHEGRPRAPRVRRNGGEAISVRAAFDEAGEMGQLAGVEHGTKDLPVDAVPANDQRSGGREPQSSSSAFTPPGVVRDASLSHSAGALEGVAGLREPEGAQREVKPQLVARIAQRPAGEALYLLEAVGDRVRVGEEGLARELHASVRMEVGLESPDQLALAPRVVVEQWPERLLHEAVDKRRLAAQEVIEQQVVEAKHGALEPQGEPDLERLARLEVGAPNPLEAGLGPTHAETPLAVQLRHHLLGHGREVDRRIGGNESDRVLRTLQHDGIGARIRGDHRCGGRNRRLFARVLAGPEADERDVAQRQVVAEDVGSSEDVLGRRVRAVEQIGKEPSARRAPTPSNSPSSAPMISRPSTRTPPRISTLRRTERRTSSMKGSPRRA